MTESAAPATEIATPAGRLGRLRAMRLWQAAAFRNFRLLWASEGVSVIGDQFHVVAMSWLIITLTGSGLALGTVLIAVSVPRALLLMPMGVVADRRSPRSMMLVSHVARALIVAAIALLAATGNASIPALAALGVLFGAADAVYMPSQQAFIPRAVDAERLPSANALLQGTYQLTSIIAPPVAGLVVAAGGTAIAFGVDAASFVLAAGVVLLISGAAAGAASARAGTTAIDAPAVQGVGTTPAAAAQGNASSTTAGVAPAEHEPFAKALVGGLRYLLEDRAIGIMLCVTLVLNFALNGPAAVGMPWLAELRFHAGATGMGLLVAGWALGGLVGTVIAGSVKTERQGRPVLLAIAASGVSFGLVGIAGSLPVAMGLFLVGGLCIGYVNIVAVSWLQARTDPSTMGRVMSIVMLVGFGISPLSMAVAGALIDLNATALFLGAGALVVAAVVMAFALGLASLFDGPSPVNPARTEA
jgi:MFS family permease